MHFIWRTFKRTNYYRVYCSTFTLVKLWCMLTEVALPSSPRSLQVLSLSNRTWGGNCLVEHSLLSNQKLNVQHTWSSPSLPLSTHAVALVHCLSSARVACFRFSIEYLWKQTSWRSVAHNRNESLMKTLVPGFTSLVLLPLKRRNPGWVRARAPPTPGWITYPAYWYSA